MEGQKKKKLKFLKDSLIFIKPSKFVYLFCHQHLGRPLGILYNEVVNKILYF